MGRLTSRPSLARRLESPKSRLGAHIIRMGTVFFFFSNRMGCLGSLLVSVVVTVVLLLVFGVL